MNKEEILGELENLAEKFSFEFNEGWFSYVVVSPRELIILQFLIGSPKPDYNKFGKGNQRLEKIGEFLKSKGYERVVEEYKNEGSGTALEKKHFERYKKEIEKISNRELKTKVKSIFKTSITLCSLVNWYGTPRPVLYYSQLNSTTTGQ